MSGVSRRIPSARLAGASRRRHCITRESLAGAQPVNRRRCVYALNLQHLPQILCKVWPGDSPRMSECGAPHCVCVCASQPASQAEPRPLALDALAGERRHTLCKN